MSALLSNKPTEIFVSYSHDNSAWFDRLRPVLKFQHCNEKAYAWNDQQMKIGDKWDKEIQSKLETMDIFVCLVSYEFLASDYIRTVEIPCAHERHSNGEIEIVPIVIYEGIDLKAECRELHGIQPLPGWGQCWRDFEKEGGHYQDAHGLIRKGLRENIEKCLARRKAAAGEP